MIFKYWVEFDSAGEIKAFYKSKSECESPCKEYVVKLIPIDRNTERLIKDMDQTAEAVEKAAKGFKKLDTEVNKTIRELRRFKI
jgi:hypothetical protein